MNDTCCMKINISYVALDTIVRILKEMAEMKETAGQNALAEDNEESYEKYSWQSSVAMELAERLLAEKKK